jgi:hypothetical protein
LVWRARRRCVWGKAARGRVPARVARRGAGREKHGFCEKFEAVTRGPYSALTAFDLPRRVAGTGAVPVVVVTGGSEQMDRRKQRRVGLAQPGHPAGGIALCLFEAALEECRFGCIVPDGVDTGFDTGRFAVACYVYAHSRATGRRQAGYAHQRQDGHHCKTSVTAQGMFSFVDGRHQNPFASCSSKQAGALCRDEIGVRRAG